MRVFAALVVFVLGHSVNGIRDYYYDIENGRLNVLGL